jgi:peptidoglycan/xylan/chitin deacetylase (PgdA/CDA1 family)
MGRRGSGILKASLSALHFSGIDNLLGPLTRGTGAVFMLHHVLPATPLAFAPNRHLEVTPEFLDRVIRLVIARGFDIVSLDDAQVRLREGALGHPFVCFTFDDGYRDTFHHAYPIFRRHGLPFAVYVASDFADGRGDLWWLALEQLLRKTETIELRIAGDMRRFSCRRPGEKTRAYRTIHQWLQQVPEADARGIVADLCRAHGLDVSGLCSELVMDWDELRDLARDPLVTIGAHSRSHLPLSQLSYAESRFEIEQSIARIEREIGRPCRHFSFPCRGDGGAEPREFELAREAGISTAVTARSGLLRPDHGLALAALPRIALNGELQKPRYVKVMLSGAPFALWALAGRLYPRGVPADAAA